MTEEQAQSHGSHRSDCSDDPSRVSETQNDSLAGAESAHSPVSPDPRSAAKSNPDAPANESSPPAAVQAALLGEPDTLPLTFCRRCKVDVKPEGKGLCPRCGKMLRHNFLARKHPINVLRRDQLRAEIIAEYQPHTLELRDACQYLAN